MENDNKKQNIKKIIVIACVIVIAAVIAWYYLIPVPVLPKDYSTMQCRYIRVGGQMYETKDGFPTDEQITRIEEILKRYSMKHTTKTFSDDGRYGFEKLYMVFAFMDENGVIHDSRGINIDGDMVASTRVRPFIDSLAIIENGDVLYKEVMEILGLQP